MSDTFKNIVLSTTADPIYRRQMSCLAYKEMKDKVQN